VYATLGIATLYTATNIMKVLHVYQAFYPKRGGIEDHILTLCRHASPEVEPVVLVANVGRRRLSLQTRHEKIDGISVIRAATWGQYFTPFCPTMALSIRRVAPDVIHLHLPCPMGIVATLLAHTAVPLVIGYHNDIVQQKWAMRAYRPILTTALRRARFILSGTLDYAKSSPILPAFRDKWRIVAYGIDQQKFERTPAIEAQIAQIQTQYPAPRILFIGRLCYYKGLEYLIPAMRQVDATLLMIGVGPWEKRLKTLVQQCGVADKVIFVGAANDTQRAAYTHASDLLVLPSTYRSEAFGLVQVQAMVCAKPVVSSDLPGVASVNEHGVTGLTVPCRDVAALAGALNQLCGDPQMRKKMGIVAQEKARRSFQVERMVTSIEAIYQESGCAAAFSS
jgi:rhamnosyl/mannosyltransferase